MKHALLIFIFAAFVYSCAAQDAAKSSKNSNPGYWQQHVDYKMEIDMDVESHQYNGKQELIYTNNSPDVLSKVYYHLYFNAFQPGSEMDARLQSIPDPDGRMTTNTGTKENPNRVSRISLLKPNEIGYIKVSKLTQNGKPVLHKTVGTILEVTLNDPIQPGQKATFNMEFDAQIPLQIRRSGRDNREGIAYSMTQWFPKLAEYDFEGWHAHPYIAREFHGVWGNFDVKLKIDKDYIVGGTGYLQNPNDVGHGYEDSGVKVKIKGKKITWHFIAPNVHDFTWAADPNYKHDIAVGPSGVKLHFLYRKDKPEIQENWKNLQSKSVELMDFFNKAIGPYPWKQYSIIQGGDGGMEYAMCTLITGERKFGSLVGVTAHEMAHAWFQHLLATNESKHEWMDEGMTSFISDMAMNQVMDQKKDNPFEGAYRGYQYLISTGKEQPQSTHADRYHENMPYGVSAYSKGEIFLAQLGYIIGQENLMKTLNEYYNQWKFKHPTPNDFKRVAEKVSGFELDWYLTDWTLTTNTIDYSINEVTIENNQTKVTLERKGAMPMPLDVFVVYEDGTQETYYIPLRMARAQKSNPYENLKRTVIDDWAWAYPTYEFTIPKNNVKAIVIDPSNLMADVDKTNNAYEKN
ncbi:MAG: M1 family metallopeptidase [Flavobacteriaceae bacterium]|nr:M1 family metallopeptidase [Flavobacteriaceae bacterium]